MQRVTNIVRWIFIALLSNIFLLNSILFALVTAATFTFTDSENPKDWIRESGVYDTSVIIVGEVLEQQSGDENIEIQRIIEELQDSESDLHGVGTRILSPPAVSSNVETVLDSVYTWLSGETDRPIFTIRVAESDEDLEEILRVGLIEKVDGLPSCEPEQQYDLDSPLQLSCKPAGLETDTYINQYIDDVSDSEEFNQLKESMVISSDLIEIDPELSSKIQTGYRVFRILPILSLLLGLILAAAIYLISPERRSTPQYIAVLMAVVSLPILASTFYAIKSSPELVQIIQNILTDRVPGQLLTSIGSILDSLIRSLLELVAIVTLIEFVTACSIFGISWYKRKGQK